MKIKIILVLSVMILSSFGCTKAEKNTKNKSEMSDRPRLSFNTTEKEHQFAIDGHHENKVVSVLKPGTDGMRELFLESKSGRLTITDSYGWYMPPASATNGENTLVCYNQLAGLPSAHTHGLLPDPINGMALKCRLFDGKNKHYDSTLASGHHINWVRDVTAQRDGSYVVTFYSDDGKLNGPDPEEVEIELAQSVVFTGNELTVGEPKIAQTFCAPLEKE